MDIRFAKKKKFMKVFSVLHGCRRAVNSLPLPPPSQIT